MIQTVLKNLLVSALILGLAAVISAQTANPTPRKNSPYSPNPKKKTGSQNPPVSIVNKPAQDLNQVKTMKVGGGVTSENVEPPKKNGAENKGPGTTEPNFESRSVAKKTLEVAKRASAVEVSPTDVYKIGVGDVLFISLQNAPAKESTYFTVLNDGTIDYPLAGEMVQILGLTTEQIEDTLKEKIKLFDNPQVSVKVREHNSHSYTILGMVEKTGEKMMQRDAIPLYVVRAEVLVQARANRAIIKREGIAPLNLDLRDSKAAETLIYPKDIIEFGSDESEGFAPKSTQFYFISGEINAGGKKDFTLGITLTQAIIESGDLKKKSARKVVIRRKNTEGMLIPSEFDLKLIKDGRAADPVLQPGDTIEVGN